MSNEVSHDPKEEERLKAAREKEKSEDEIDLEHWRTVLATDSGRYVVWKILCETGYMGICGSNSPADLTEHNAKRKIGRFIVVDKIEQVDPDIYLRMILENRETETDGGKRRKRK